MKRVLNIVFPCLLKLLLFTASLVLAWSAAGWKMALALFLLAWVVNIARKTGTSI
jgi:hypothetical protein